MHEDIRRIKAKKQETSGSAATRNHSGDARTAHETDDTVRPKWRSHNNCTLGAAPETRPNRFPAASSTTSPVVANHEICRGPAIAAMAIIAAVIAVSPPHRTATSGAQTQRNKTQAASHRQEGKLVTFSTRAWLERAEAEERESDGGEVRSSRSVDGAAGKEESGDT